ncbi:MAG: pseudaminic acid synthase [Emcibacter sp.]|nr:pseudaminic acid synthase [Emcibacter sp.]
MNKSIKIGKDYLGSGYPPYIIAEMSGNHNQDINKALNIIDAAKDAGAHAVKLQTYTADTITIDHDGDEFMVKGGLWDGRNLYELYAEAHTPWNWHKDLFDYARKKDITIFSSPFDRTAIDLLENLNAPAYKIASFEIIDLPLIRYAAETGKPLIMSTGIANQEEIAEAIEAVYETGNENLVILHCVSGYPSDPKEANLKTMGDIARRFDVLSGLSDHSHGIAVAVAATALGASVIEKHLTLDRAEGGVDSAFSLEPQEFAELVSACKVAHDALGDVNYDLKKSELATQRFRRSLYAVANIKKGEMLTENNIRSIRPGLGIKPKYYDEVLGQKACQDIARGTPLSWDMLRNEDHK